MNYIELNGIRSDTISGLIIQELPPITKPKLRANIEEIDGRDGDIITPLGYSAYDKELLIGLARNFDIDEIIQYFNGSGTVTFSNEPDKYYNYTILDQIDYERLLRFKKAAVKLHIQPFKYSVTDNSKTFEIDENTSQIQIYNVGNIYSKPVLTIKGTGTINLYLNNIQIFSIALGTFTEIVIDTNKMEAYQGGNLLNRLVAGNYDNFSLNVGKNIISWTGNVTEIQIDNFSRWI